MMNEVPINSENLVEYIRVLFPELEDEYQEVANGWEGDRSNYIIVGNVLKPYFVHEAQKGQITEFLRRFGQFVERLCTDGDLAALNVIWIRIFEWLIFHPKELSLMWPIFGPFTKENIKDAAHRWSIAGRFYGKVENLPEDNCMRLA
jgi:hypothetical protein